MDELRICLFGRLSASRDGQIIPGLDARRVQELLCYLLLYRDRAHPREALAGLLWEQVPITSSKKCLRQALWRLEAVLEPGSESGSERVLAVDPDWIQVNPKANLWLDVAVFEKAFTGVQDLPGKQLDGERAQLLRVAEQLYAGDLLDGCYQDWCLCERERLQNMYLAMLQKLMLYCEANREYEGGLVYGDRILRYDPACERTHRCLMRMHYMAGNRTTALRQYDHCLKALAETLDARPGRHTVTLYEQIHGHQPIATASVPAAANATSQARAPLPEAMNELEQLQSSLADLQRRVKQAIQAIDRALTGIV